ncbi:TauD/TfdA dioxygenase family protein [Nocardia macrotermitis]|uniref:Alpha-ketoglutarate-dependent 2,4-dichlorophenoxyacetate dioxygenase n=1 Tax=Nocardia macrotermitis TaxID=2585198 RepID=A0A7K0CZ23_9NOCA|nr:TauD/TfdA family dioxygenase [Nocardia macrotermitis]MQY18735.1 Alpha-ketoglutarate-dependent 2,4-dichlorophenoxyacetate dioxygenase [Nocardia macrotermitis]
MSALTTEKLSETVGVRILGVDAERLVTDEDLPGRCLELLERHSVLLFPELHAGDEAQVAFSRKMGPLAKFPNFPNEHVMIISFDPDNPNAKYYPSNDYWHIDGSMDEVPARASIMSAHNITAEGGETAFASTYAAYDALTDQEKDRFAGLRVVHRMARIQSRTFANPTPEQRADWARFPDREHPLVWTHESGRRSLVFGASASHVVGMDLEEGAALLEELQDRATTPDRVYKHTWSVGDLVIWDNTGLVHRACEFDRSLPRRMHRSTLVGQEPIQ